MGAYSPTHTHDVAELSVDADRHERGEGSERDFNNESFTHECNKGCSSIFPGSGGMRLII